MYLYSADIGSTFLAELDSPAVAPKRQPSMTIQVTSIAFKPYRSLRSRLLTALLPTDCGTGTQNMVWRPLDREDSVGGSKGGTERVQNSSKRSVDISLFTS